MKTAIPVWILTMALSASAADLVLRNGKILTLDAAQPEVQAIAITAGKIVARGTNAQMSSQITPATRVVDLGGRLATPGMIEGHGHFTGVGQAKMALNLRDVKSWMKLSPWWRLRPKKPSRGSGLWAAAGIRKSGTNDLCRM